MSENTKKEKNDEVDIATQIEVATQTLERNIGFVTNCDNKTSIVLAIIGVLFTIILTNDGLNTIYNLINTCVEKKNFCSILYLIFFASSILVMIRGLYNLCSVLIAKTEKNIAGAVGENSRIFFAGINRHGNYKTYKEKFCKMSQQELLDELIAQIYINADIATCKYSKYNTGLKLTLVGFCLFAVILLIGIYTY